MKILFSIITLAFIIICSVVSSSNQLKNYLIRIVYFGEFDHISSLIRTIDTKNNSESKKEFATDDVPYIPYIHKVDYSMMSGEIEPLLSKNHLIVTLLEKQNIQNLKLEKRIITENRENSIYSIRITVFREYSENQNYPDLMTKKGFFIIGCLYLQNLDTIIYIDSEFIRREHKGHTSLFRGSFSQSGQYYYYMKNNKALRYDIDSKSIETLPYGEKPVVPRNHSNILVFSQTKKTLYLLDENLKLISSIKTDKVNPTTVLHLDGYKYMISSKNKASHFSEGSMDIDIFDFESEEKIFLTKAGMGLVVDISQK